MNKEPQLGGHLDAKSGLRHVVLNARALSYNVIQTMVGDPRGYQPYDIPAEDAREYRKMAFGIETYVHLPYVINPCEAVPQRRGFYKRAMKAFMQAATAIGARAVVLHPGFKKELTADEAYKNLLKFLEETVDDDGPIDVLLETDAGSKNGSAIGSTGLIGKAVEDLGNTRIAMCIDTCHLFARGTNLWEKEDLDHLLAEHHHMIRLVHLNVPDPEVSLGSNLDRHNTPFEERTDLAHENLIKTLVGRFPCVLERRSLAVQEKDVKFIRKLTEKGENRPEG